MMRHVRHTPILFQRHRHPRRLAQDPAEEAVDVASSQ